MENHIQALGIIHTQFTDKKNLPIQSSRSHFPGTVEVFPQYAEGLEGIEEFSHIYLLYTFHCAGEEVSLSVQPFLDDKPHGIFTTRHPHRPNHIGLSIVRLMSRNDNVIEFMGADMLDGTPLLDIKPYIPDFDVFTVEKTGWYSKRKLP